MKIKKLQILDKTIYLGGDMAKADSTTHDIERLPGEGYLIRHKVSKRVYFLPSELAVAELDDEQEEDDAGAAPAARRSAGGRGRAPKDATPVQG